MIFKNDRKMYITFAFLLCIVVIRVPAEIVHREDRQLADELQQLKDRMAAIETGMESCGCAAQAPVAFKARLSHGITPAADQIVVFDDVTLNLGQAYHAHNGIFVAPRNGVYLFSVSACSDNGHYIVLDLLRNGVIVGQVLGGDNSYDDCSSETTIVQLAAGDDVYLKHHGASGDLILNSKINSFTGALLQAL